MIKKNVIFRIFKSARLGFVNVKAPKVRMKLNAIANYLGKYIGKGYDYEELNVRKSPRRLGLHLLSFKNTLRSMLSLFSQYSITFSIYDN